MINIPPLLAPWLDALLSGQTEPVKNALNKLPESPLSDIALAALEIVWQLHDDEAIVVQAGEILVNEIDEKKAHLVAEGFQIFHSVTEVLPWMDENSTALQLNNFQAFRTIKDRYEFLLATHNYYTERYLDVARKLYMLFKLEEEAASCFQGIIKYNQRCDEAYYALGRMQEKKQDYESAKELYEQSVAINPENVFAQLQLGALKVNIFEQYEEGIVHYNKVIEMDPYSAEPYVRVAESYYHLEQFDRCKQFIEIAVSINEFHEEALNLLGTIYWKIDNDYEKAVETYQKGLDHILHGDSALLLGSLGDLYAQYLQDYNKARLYYEKSLKVNPVQKHIVQQFIPILLRVFQDFASVSMIYENYLRTALNDIEIRTGFAAFLIEYLHDYELAYEQLQIVLKTDAEYQPAQKLISRIGEYVSAQENIEKEKDDNTDPEDWNDDDFPDDFDEEDDDDEDDDDDFVGGGAAGDN